MLMMQFHLALAGPDLCLIGAADAHERSLALALISAW